MTSPVTILIWKNLFLSKLNTYFWGGWGGVWCKTKCALDCITGNYCTFHWAAQFSNLILTSAVQFDTLYSTSLLTFRICESRTNALLMWNQWPNLGYFISPVYMLVACDFTLCFLFLQAVGCHLCYHCRRIDSSWLLQVFAFCLALYDVQDAVNGISLEYLAICCTVLYVWWFFQIWALPN